MLRAVVSGATRIAATKNSRPISRVFSRKLSMVDSLPEMTEARSLRDRPKQALDALGRAFAVVEPFPDFHHDVIKEISAVSELALDSMTAVDYLKRLPDNQGALRPALAFSLLPDPNKLVASSSTTSEVDALVDEAYRSDVTSTRASDLSQRLEDVATTIDAKGAALLCLAGTASSDAFRRGALYSSSLSRLDDVIDAQKGESTPIIKAMHAVLLGRVAQHLHVEEKRPVESEGLYRSCTGALAGLDLTRCPALHAERTAATHRFAALLRDWDGREPEADRLLVDADDCADVDAVALTTDACFAMGTWRLE